jgi:hypothetical protein
MEPERLVVAAEQLSRTLTPGDLDHTLQQVTAAAVEVLPGVDYASISIKHDDGRLETFAPTHHVVVELDRLQYELQEGPCYEASVEVAHVSAPNLRSDPRYPRYGPRAAEAGIRSQAGVRLFDGTKAQGALNVYSQQVGAFAGVEALTKLFAHQSATALQYANEVQDLRQAMVSRQTIGQAIGILMERYGLTQERAFAFLSRLSSNSNTKLRVVADQLVSNRDLGPPPSD